MKHLGVKARRISALMIPLLILSLGLFVPPTPKAAAYSCGDVSNPASECYAAATWGRSVNGASTTIQIVPLYSPDGIVANQMWIKDNSSTGCTTYPYCWLEGGYAYANWVNNSTSFEYLAAINPAGSLNFWMLGTIPAGQTGNIYLAIQHSGYKQFTVAYHSFNYYTNNFTISLQNEMSPNFIQIGMRLSGSGGATSSTAAFNNNCYFLGGSCYSQSDPGSPPQGYVSSPPYGAWHPQPSNQVGGGTWYTSMTPIYYLLGSDCSDNNYRCFLGYSYTVQNFGVEAQITTPIQVNTGDKGFSSMLLNMQGQYSVGHYNAFAQVGIVWASPAGGFCGVILTPFSEWNNRDTNTGYVQDFSCLNSLNAGTQYSFAVQYDHNTDSDIFEINGGSVYFHRVDWNISGIDGAASVSVYGETNSKTIQMGGPNSGSKVRASRIGYKSTYTSGFTYPFVTNPDPYAGMDENICNANPCPYNRDFGNDGNNPFWYVEIWTR